MSLYVCILYIVYHYELSIVESISTYLKYTIPSPLTSFIPFTVLIYMINRQIQKTRKFTVFSPIPVCEQPISFGFFDFELFKK